VYYQMTEQVKRRMIEELRRFWATHPRYADIVDHIQGKYSFKERPQYGIVLKSASASHMQMSADNFLGTVHSYVMLSTIGDSPGLSVEWVREDSLAIQRNQGRFPSLPGVYYCEVQEASPPNPPYLAEATYEFYVDPLLDVTNETLARIDDLHYQTTSPPLDGSLRLFEMPGAVPLKVGEDYTVDYTTGVVALAVPVVRRGSLSADYRYVGTSTGPHPLALGESNHTAIPGAVIAFGRRVQAGDRFAVVVTPYREPVALEYGGRWELSIDFDIIARDVFAQQEISDATIMYLWGVARNRLSSEGIEITQVSGGGESEEAADENADDYFYNASFSVSLQADWAIHVPLAAYLRAVTPEFAGLESLPIEAHDTLTATAASLQTLSRLGVTPVVDPYFYGPAGMVGARSTMSTVR
jgi:hypothetical protein